MFTKQSFAAFAVFSAAMGVPLMGRDDSCNPAHSYPNGQACVSTNGGLSLVSTAAPASTTYACNPAHSYPEGKSCVSTNGGLTLVSPASSTAAASVACNPAHSYPEGKSCISTNGGLTLVSPATTTEAPASTTYACNPAHSYPAGAACISTNGGLTLVTAAPSQSSAASSAVAAVATAAASSGETISRDVTWTANNVTRYCGEAGTGCDYDFTLTASDNRPEQKCTILRENVANPTTESWSNQQCQDSNYYVSWGYSDQFGAASAFAVMTVLNDEEKAKAYFGVANVNSQPATPSTPAGSGQYGNIGPQPVYLY